MKRNKNLKRTLNYSMTIGGAGLLSSGLPTVAKAPVQAVITAGSGAVAPLASVTGAGIVVGELRKLKLKKRKLR